MRDYIFTSMHHLWLPDSFIKDLMIAHHGKDRPSDRLISYCLYSHAHLPTLPDLKIVEGHRDSRPCPAFFAACFREISGNAALFSIKELLLIAERYQLSLPGQLIHEIQSEAEKDLHALEMYLQLMEHSYLDWGALFSFAEAYHTHNSLSSFKKLSPKKQTFAWLTAWVWQNHKHYQDWWPNLKASSRTECLQSILYRKADQASAWAINQKSDKSKKAQALLNALVCKDKDSQFYQSLLTVVKKNSLAAELKWITASKANLLLPIPHLMERFDFDFYQGIAWLDPADLFKQVKNGRLLTEGLAQIKNPEPLLAALLHGAIYHKNDAWTLYFMKVTHHLNCAQLFEQSAWSELIQWIPSRLIFKHIDEGFKTAQTDMDKIDLIQYWLQPSKQFIPKSFSEKLSTFLFPLIDYIGRNEIRLEDNKGFLRYLARHLHPSVVQHMELAYTESEHLPSNRLRRRLNHRLKLYKALYQWQSKNN